MNWRILCFLLLQLLPSKAVAAVVVTYRGDTPNIFGFLQSPSEADFDVNADGIQDYHFITDGYFVAAIQSRGANRFISTLEVGPDIGGNVTPVDLGSILGVNTAFPPGDWHHHSDNGGGSMFGLNSGSNSMQFADAYIGVEFAAADGIHYGWIQYVGFSHPEKGVPFPLLGGFIDSWAWETEPGMPIIAGAIPEPIKGIYLGTGAALLLSRRKKRHLSRSELAC